MHSIGVLHRDLKTDNILIDENNNCLIKMRILITDLGKEIIQGNKKKKPVIMKKFEDFDINNITFQRTTHVTKPKTIKQKWFLDHNRSLSLSITDKNNTKALYENRKSILDRSKLLTEISHDAHKKKNKYKEIEVNKTNIKISKY